MPNSRSKSRRWANLLIAQEFNVPGGVEQASKCSAKMLAAIAVDNRPKEIPGIIQDLTVRKLELRSIIDTRASEVADVIWRAIKVLEGQQTPAKVEPSDEMRVGENDMRYAG